jgi:hypothetical protein
MNKIVNLKNKYYSISNFSEMDSTLNLLLDQENLIGINILNLEVRNRLEWYFNPFENQKDNDIQKMINTISNQFYGKEQNFNVLIETDLNFSLIICAIIEIVMKNKQFDADSYKRIIKLLEYFYIYKNQEWREYQIPTKEHPWNIVNGESTKKYEIIEDFLNSNSLNILVKIQHTINFILNNTLPDKSIKIIELNKSNLLELLSTKQIEVNYTLIPQISLVKGFSNLRHDLAFDLGYLISPIVIYQKLDLEDNFSKIYIQDRKGIITNKDELLIDLNKIYSLNNQKPKGKYKYGNIFLDSIETSNIKVDHILLTVAKYIK